MKNYMKRLTDINRCNDLARPINIAATADGYWEMLYAAKEYKNK